MISKFACVLFLILGFWIGQYVYVPDFVTNGKEQKITDDRGVQVSIPDYPTAVIPSDLRLSPIIEAFGREATIRDRKKSIMVTLPKDLNYIDNKTKTEFPIVVLDMSSPSKVLETYTKLGNIFHREDIANAITMGCGDALTNAIGHVSELPKKKVLYLKSGYEIPVKDSIENNILVESHVLSIWDSGIYIMNDDESKNYDKITKEQIATFNPDLIICKQSSDKRIISKDLADLEAVKAGQVFAIEDEDYHFEFDEYHSIPAVLWVIKKAYDRNTSDPDSFYKWYLSATKFNNKF